jgi:hypothetical protein
MERAPAAFGVDSRATRSRRCRDWHAPRVLDRHFPASAGEQFGKPLIADSIPAAGATIALPERTHRSPRTTNAKHCASANMIRSLHPCTLRATCQWSRADRRSRAAPVTASQRGAEAAG